MKKCHYGTKTRWSTKNSLLYKLYFEMPQAISKFTMVNTDTTTKEYSEQSEGMRHLVVKPVLKI